MALGRSGLVCSTAAMSDSVRALRSSTLAQKKCHHGQVPQQVDGTPVWARWAANVRVRHGQHIGKALGFSTNDRNPVHWLRISVSDRPTNVGDVITVDDVRRITASLPSVLRGGGARPDQVPGRTDRLCRVFA